MPLAMIATYKIAEVFSSPSAPAATPAPSAGNTNQANADAFRKAEHSDPGLMDAAAMRVTVKKGDTLEGLLRARGYSNSEIYAKNADGKTMLDTVVGQNKLTDANTIQAGQELKFDTQGKDKPTAQETKVRLEEKKEALKEAVSGNNVFQEGVDKGSKYISDGIRGGAGWLGKQFSNSTDKSVMGGLGELGGGIVDGLAHVVSHPVATVEALGNAIAHPIDTAKAMGADVERVYDKEGFAGAAVYAVGNLALMATGVGGAARAAGTVAGKAGSVAEVAGKSTQVTTRLRTPGSLARESAPQGRTIDLKKNADGVYEAPSEPGYLRKNWEARDNGSYYEAATPRLDRSPGWLRRAVDQEQRMIEDSGARFSVQA